LTEPSEPRIGICVLVERTGAASAACFRACMEIAQEGWPQLWVPPCHVDLARNKAARQFLDSDLTHLLFLDCDHRHPKNIVHRLARWVKRDPSLLVVSGMAFRRCPPFDPTAYMADDDGNVYQITSWQPGLMRVDLVGAPCLLVNREVFERIPAPWFAFDYSHAGEDKYPGEDIYFSLRCKEHGIDIWVDTTTVSPHAMESWVDGNTYRTHMATQPVGGKLMDYADLGGTIKSWSRSS
jgi:hypothetical protein